MDVLNGGAGSGVYWQVGSSATLGTTTDFAGNILALASITLNNGADILCGRALAQTGAVTMDSNTISNNCDSNNGGTGNTDFGSLGFSGGPTSAVPESSTWAMLLLGFAGLGLAGFRRARKNRATISA